MIVAEALVNGKPEKKIKTLRTLSTTNSRRAASRSDGMMITATTVMTMMMPRSQKQLMLVWVGGEAHSEKTGPVRSVAKLLLCSLKLSWTSEARPIQAAIWAVFSHTFQFQYLGIANLTPNGLRVFFFILGSDNYIPRKTSLAGIPFHLTIWRTGW